MQAHLTDRLCIRFQQVLFLTAAITYPANGKIWNNCLNTTFEKSVWETILKRKKSPYNYPYKEYKTNV